LVTVTSPPLLLSLLSLFVSRFYPPFFPAPATTRSKHNGKTDLPSLLSLFFVTPLTVTPLLAFLPFPFPENVAVNVRVVLFSPLFFTPSSETAAGCRHLPYGFFLRVAKRQRERHTLSFPPFSIAALDGRFFPPPTMAVKRWC